MAESFEEYQAKIEKAEACEATENESRALAMGEVDENGYSAIDKKINDQYNTDKYQTVRTDVANCYAGIERTPGFLDEMVGFAKDSFDKAANAVKSIDVTPQLVKDVDSALDRANTSDSEQNRRWDRQIAESTGPSM